VRVQLIACIDVVEVVTDWMEGVLDDDLRTDLEEHLVICPDCAAFARQLRLTRQALGTLGDTEPPPLLRNRLLEAFAEWTDRGGE